MRVKIRPRCQVFALCAAAGFGFGYGTARAEDATTWRDIETKYIFGFTTGSGIGLEGEKEFTIDTIARGSASATVATRASRDEVRI